MDQKSELLDSNNYIVDQLKQSFNELRAKIDLKEK